MSVTLPVLKAMLHGSHSVSPYTSFCIFDGNAGKQTTASFCFFAHHHGSTAQNSELSPQKLLSPHLCLHALLPAYDDQAAKVTRAAELKSSSSASQRTRMQEKLQINGKL